MNYLNDRFLDFFENVRKQLCGQLFPERIKKLENKKLGIKNRRNWNKQVSNIWDERSDKRIINGKNQDDIEADQVKMDIQLGMGTERISQFDKTVYLYSSRRW